MDAIAAAREQGSGRGQPDHLLKEKYGIVGTKVPYFSYLAAWDLHMRPSLVPSAKRTFTWRSRRLPSPTQINLSIRP